VAAVIAAARRRHLRGLGRHPTRRAMAALARHLAGDASPSRGGSAPMPPPSPAGAAAPPPDPACPTCGGGDLFRSRARPGLARCRACGTETSLADPT
jgi:hypothetical protein